MKVDLLQTVLYQDLLVFLKLAFFDMKKLRKENTQELDIVNVKLNEDGKYEVFFTNIPVPVKMNQQYLDVISKSMDIDYRQFITNH